MTTPTPPEKNEIKLNPTIELSTGCLALFVLPYVAFGFTMIWLKVEGHVDWGWWLVLSPFHWPLSLLALLVVLAVAIGIIACVVAVSIVAWEKVSEWRNS